MKMILSIGGVSQVVKTGQDEVNETTCDFCGEELNMEPEEDGTWVCGYCNETKSYDNGCDDGFPNMCDECWGKIVEPNICEPLSGIITYV